MLTPFTIYPTAAWGVTLQGTVNPLCRGKTNSTGNRMVGWCNSTVGTQHTRQSTDGKARKTGARSQKDARTLSSRQKRVSEGFHNNGALWQPDEDQT